MKTIYFDCFAGASGDMIAGVFLDLGLDFHFLKAELKKIPLTGYDLQYSKVNKNGLHATSFEVYIKDPGHDAILTDSDFREVENHDVESPDNISSKHDSHDSHRSLSDVLSIIRDSKLEISEKNKIEQIFLRLGQAEATVHGVDIQDIHLHEVGSIDAIIDIATAVIGFKWLRASEIIVSAIHLGTGFIKTSHGLLPVPAPATAELIKGFPVYTSDAKGELLTPTGAVILSSYATRFGPLPPLAIEKIGCGAGKRDREFPNVLRAYVGTNAREASASNRDPSPEQHLAIPTPGGYHENDAVILVANIDDMNPQLFGNLMDKLLEAGVMDVTFTPIYMKKNRPATSVEVMIAPYELDKILSIIFTESSTIGVRSYRINKHMLQREIQVIETEFGTVRIKVSRLAERIVNTQPEYEDCIRISQALQLPVKEVYARILRSTGQLNQDSPG
jgi:pyridinium-3,5-bisthiocarboxylic acid mononucleotide nickel chelatase